jgi:rubrerythrin
MQHPKTEGGNYVYSISMPYIPINPAEHYYHYGLIRQQPLSYKTLQEALNLIKLAVAGEREDEVFYDYLISVAPSREEKEIIESIRNDERKHNQMFRKMYQDLTGQTIMAPTDVEFRKPKSFIDGIRRALFGELSAVERYRDIRAGLPERYYRDMVFEILTDELKHASKYNYILNLDLRRMIEK